MSAALSDTTASHAAVRPYADAAMSYLGKGLSPLPTPPGGAKAPVPTGYTGRLGVDANYADVDSWIEGVNGRFNGRSGVALRMPRGVVVDGREHWGVAIDVDCYDGKRGAETLARWTERAGMPLPPTWSATSRGADSPSRKYVYLIPAGTRLIGGEGDCETIQSHHRFLYAPPSLNAKDAMRPVRWYDETDAERHHDELPEPAHWPILPQQWIDVLRDARPETAVPVLDDAEHAAMIASFTGGEPCKGMRTALAKVQDAIRAGSRHEAMLPVVLSLLRQGERGCTGFHTAIRAAQDSFVAAVAPSRTGGQEEAIAEFERMVTGKQGLGRIAADRTPADKRGCRCGSGFGVAEIAEAIRTAFETGEEAGDTIDTLLSVVGDDEFDAAFERATGHTVRPFEPAPKPSPAALRVVRDTPAPTAQKPATKTPAAPKTAGTSQAPAAPEKTEAFDFRRAADFTEAGLGQRFVAYFGRKRVAYVPGANLLRSWTGTVWRTDDGAALRHGMEELTLLMAAQARLESAAADRLEEEAAAAVRAAKDAGDKQAEDEAKLAAAALVARNKAIREYAGYVTKMRKGSALDQGCKSARSNPALRIDEGEWNADVRAFNVLNGTLWIDFDGNVELRPHDPDDLLTQQASVVYDPDAVSPMFDLFLQESVPDPAVRRVLRALAGLSLIGDNSKNVFPFLLGPTRSGKTTILEVVGGVLDNAKTPALGYAGSFNLDLLRPRRNTAGDPQLMYLIDRRMIWTVEVSDGLPLNADQVKKFSGGDRRNARDNFDRKDGVQDRQPRFVPWAASNKPPQIDSADDALMERIIPIEFPNTRPADKRVDNLAARVVKTEASGVLLWMLEGLRDVIANPMIIRDLPEACTRLRAEMYAETNPVRRWLAERTEPCPCEDGSECVTHAAAWQNFTKMMDYEREAKITNNAFGRAVKDAGHPAVSARRKEADGKSKVVKIRKGLRFTEEERLRQVEEELEREALRQGGVGSGIRIGGGDDD
ncbi:hypothetical protein [Saccharothrix texasensis]|uniref:Phage/plasmid-associated DNA primase n=1 Tax=Saccharothrix texasensis TaxID=103734 RepID=A0A3N1H4K3_9PSEU|nr:hypothetical protein [Saccharothrix texasensis]ROP37450.1 phage/plasmid-associated DNA primase [Saccharothrix texasensis]